MQKELQKHYLRNNLLFLFLLLVGSLSWSLTMIKSGLDYSFGMGFWGANGHDGVWHIALANSLARGSWDMPTFAGFALKNYHVGFDLFLAVLHKATAIPTHVLYFQVLPPLVALLIGLLTYRFVIEWKNSKAQALWAVFFVYFGSGFGWLVTLLRGSGLGGESMFWAQQSVSTLINPPFAWSLIFLLLGLIYLIKLHKKPVSKYIIICTISFGILIQIKAYAGALALGGLLVAGVFDFLKNKNLSILKVFIGSLVLSLILFLPLNKNASGLLVWQPGWFLETMMGLSDRLNWPKFYSAMMNYKQGGSPKVIPAYVVAFAIFWIGNLGIRVIKDISFLSWLRNYKKINFIQVFLLSIILTAAILPMLFLQKGTPWNTIQFFYYSLFLSSIIAGVTVGEYLPKFKSLQLKYLFSLIIIFFTIPTSLSTLYYHYLPTRPPAQISTLELEALRFLERQSPGIVLTYPFDKAKADEAVVNPPRPLYLYESTAYVAAFANKDVFLEDEVNLDITGYDWKSRRQQIEAFYESLDEQYVYHFLRDNNITYLYWTRGQRATKGETELGIERIFENEKVDIYRVKRYN